MKTSQSTVPALSKLKSHGSRKFIIPLLLVLTTFSVSTFALGRNNAPCSLGDDCAATIYYRICNNWCFWY